MACKKKTHHHTFTVDSSHATGWRHHCLDLFHLLLPYSSQCSTSLAVCKRYLHEQKQGASNCYVIVNSHSPLSGKNIGFELPVNPFSGAHEWNANGILVGIPYGPQHLSSALHHDQRVFNHGCAADSSLAKNFQHRTPEYLSHGNNHARLAHELPPEHVVSHKPLDATACFVKLLLIISLQRCIFSEIEKNLSARSNGHVLGKRCGETSQAVFHIGNSCCCISHVLTLFEPCIFLKTPQECCSFSFLECPVRSNSPLSLLHSSTRYCRQLCFQTLTVNTFCLIVLNDSIAACSLACANDIGLYRCYVVFKNFQSWERVFQHM